MKVMVIVKASPSSEAGKMPSEALLTAMGNYNESLFNAGIMEAGEGLKPSSEGYRVRFSGKDRTVTPGPFPATHELMAGYWIWQVESIEEALEWVKKCPNPMEEESDIEIRPLVEAGAFDEVDTTGEILQKEDALRNAMALKKGAVNSYLFFAGRCEEALAFYRQHLGAKVEFIMRFNESPEPCAEGMLQPGFENKIMHAEFRLGDMKFFASDGMNETSTFRGFSLVLTVPTKDDAHRIFNALAEGGKVDMPLNETFFSPLYGQVTDPFGVGWMVMLPGSKS